MNKQGSGIAVETDVTKSFDIKNMINSTVDEFGSLDILVNNAGASWGEPIDEFAEKGWDKVMDLNVKGLFYMTQKCLPLLRASGSQENPSSSY